MAKVTDIALVGGIALIAFIAYKGIGGFLNNFKNPFEGAQLPTINISNPFNLSTPVNTTYPNAPNNDLAFLESIRGGFASQNTTLENYIKLLDANLTKLGTPANPANAPTSPTTIDVILNDPTLTDEQKRNALDIIFKKDQGTKTDAEYYGSGVGNLTGEFNPPNVFGFGILGENQKGIPLSLAQQLNLVGKSVSDLSAKQIKLLSYIDIKETFDIIKQGKAGVNVTDFLTAFSQKVDANQNLNEVVSIADVMKSDVSRADAVIKNNQQAPQTTSQPASGLYGGTVFIQTPNQFGGFVGGKINPNPVDTLTEVLSIFPTLTAGQAQDVLREIKKVNPLGLAPSTVLTLFPTGDIKNLSSFGSDPPQIFNNNSLGIPNATPEYISNLLNKHLA